LALNITLCILGKWRAKCTALGYSSCISIANKHPVTSGALHIEHQDIVEPHLVHNQIA
jgi:hypothetical protein